MKLNMNIVNLDELTFCEDHDIAISATGTGHAAGELGLIWWVHGEENHQQTYNRKSCF